MVGPWYSHVLHNLRFNHYWNTWADMLTCTVQTRVVQGSAVVNFSFQTHETALLGRSKVTYWQFSHGLAYIFNLTATVLRTFGEWPVLGSRCLSWGYWRLYFLLHIDHAFLQKQSVGLPGAPLSSVFSMWFSLQLMGCSWDRVGADWL